MARKAIPETKSNKLDRKYLWGIPLLIILAVAGTLTVSRMVVTPEEGAEISPEQLILCDPPYIRYAAGCCLDKNANSICDEDERVTKPRVVREKVPATASTSEESTSTTTAPGTTTPTTTSGTTIAPGTTTPSTTGTGTTTSPSTTSGTTTETSETTTPATTTTSTSGTAGTTDTTSEPAGTETPPASSGTTSTTTTPAATKTTTPAPTSTTPATETNCRDSTDNDNDGPADGYDYDCYNQVCDSSGIFNKFWTWSYLMPEQAILYSSHSLPPADSQDRRRIQCCVLLNSCSTINGECVVYDNIQPTAAQWNCGNNHNWDRCRSSNVGTQSDGGGYTCALIRGNYGWVRE